MATNEEILEEHINEARAIAALAQKENRKLTKIEAREARDHIARAESTKAMIEQMAEDDKHRKSDMVEIQAQIDRLHSGDTNNGPERGFAKVVLEAGFDLRAQPRVEIPSRAIFNASTLPGEETWRVAPTGDRSARPGQAVPLHEPA